MNYTDYNCVLDGNSESQIGYLWLGNYTPSRDIDFLKKNGINYVLTALPQSMAGRPEYKDHNINHMIADLQDQPGCKINVYFEKAYEFIENALQNGNCLVHCGAGVSRSTTMALAWWIKKHGSKLDEGLALFKKRRPICNPNTGFMAQLRGWEKMWAD